MQSWHLPCISENRGLYYPDITSRGPSLIDCCQPLSLSWTGEQKVMEVSYTLPVKCNRKQMHLWAQTHLDYHQLWVSQTFKCDISLWVLQMFHSSLPPSPNQDNRFQKKWAATDFLVVKNWRRELGQWIRIPWFCKQTVLLKEETPPLTGWDPTSPLNFPPTHQGM